MSMYREFGKLGFVLVHVSNMVVVSPPLDELSQLRLSSSASCMCFQLCQFQTNEMREDQEELDRERGVTR